MSSLLQELTLILTIMW